MIEDIPYSKKINWPVFVVFVILMLVMLLYFDRAWADEKDPQAMSIAEKAIAAMGGMDQWKQVGAIRFNFQVEQQGAAPQAVKHLWDHKNGRDHVEGEKDGKTLVAWVDMTKKIGNAWLNGKKLEGDQLRQAIDWAYARWVNDTYWFIMPFKMLDSGVNLKYEGEKHGHNILHLSFNRVGLTPGDQYWAYINKQSGMMDQWEYLLQGEKEKGTWDWKEWGDYGKMKFSKLKVSSDKKVAIRFEPLTVMDSADPGYFGNDLKTLE